MHKLTTFKNNARLIQALIPHTHVIHCGLIINAGSRDENKLNNGIAHYIEHTVFKGTKSKKASQVLSFIEEVGGELNAYTTREKTCYYVSCLSEYADRAVEIICDIAFNATFPEKEIQKEKRVITEEIEMYDDTPDESIYDHFYSMLFAKHPLGYNILGTKATVKSFERKDIRDFTKRLYVPENVVLSIAGNLSYAKGEKLAHKYLAHLDGKSAGNERNSPAVNKFFDKKKKTDFTQAHCMTGNMVYSKHDPKKYGLALINNILGGAGMSARLNMSVREKHGLTYSIASNYSSYQDTGVFSIYFACDKKNIPQCRELVNVELAKMCKQKLTSAQLERAKVQLLGQAALMDENYSVKMQTMGRSLLDYDKFVSFKDFFKKIEKVTSAEILEICNEVLRPENMSTLVFDSQ